MRTAQEIVNDEVLICLSSLVSTLAAGYGATFLDNARLGRSTSAQTDLAVLCDQAGELAAPIDDWEEAAIQDGWHFVRSETDRALVFEHTDGRINLNATWGELCDEQGLSAYQREVFEHWAVTDWLADELDAKGEKVDKDFAGMCVWARTTTGQAIYVDAVFEAIAAELAS